MTGRATEGPGCYAGLVTDRKLRVAIFDRIRGEYDQTLGAGRVYCFSGL